MPVPASLQVPGAAGHRDPRRPAAVATLCRQPHAADPLRLPAHPPTLLRPHTCSGGGGRGRGAGKRSEGFAPPCPAQPPQTVAHSSAQPGGRVGGRGQAAAQGGMFQSAASGAQRRPALAGTTALCLPVRRPWVGGTVVVAGGRLGRRQWVRLVSFLCRGSCRAGGCVSIGSHALAAAAPSLPGSRLVTSGGSVQGHVLVAGGRRSSMPGTACSSSVFSDPPPAHLQEAAAPPCAPGSQLLVSFGWHSDRARPSSCGSKYEAAAGGNGGAVTGVGARAGLSSRRRRRRSRGGNCE